MASTSSLDTFLGVQIFLILFTAVFIALRFTANYKHTGRFQIDDYFALLGLCLMTGLAAVYFSMAKMMIDEFSTALQSGKMWRLIMSTYFIGPYSAYFAKSPLLILYIHLFGVKKWLRVASYTTLVTTFLLALAFAAYVSADCAPSGARVSEAHVARCVGKAYVVNIANAVISLATDIIIFCLPIPVIVKLQLPTSKKIGIVMIFCWGIIAIVASGLSLYFKCISSDNLSSGAMVGMICTLVDSIIALIVGCAPAMYSLWSKDIARLGVFSKIQSWASSLRTSRSHKSRDTSSSQSAKDSSDYSANHEYIVLEEGQRGRC